MKKSILIAVAIIALLGAGIGIKMYNKPHQDMTTAESDLTITATDLLSAFETDEENANKQYNDKVVAVTGSVLSVSNEGGLTQVTLDAGNPMGGVICELDDLTEHDRTDFQEGETVTFKGLCTGYLMDVVLVRCVEIK